MGALSLTASKAVQRRGFGPLVPGVFHVPYPRAEAEESLGAIERLFRTVLPPEEVAAIVVEPVQGEGGYLLPPPGFLPQLHDLARAHGILLIADEVQSGIGRTGKLWACDHFGLVPDILTSAKGIASGMPLSAMIARAELMNWAPGAHASTFGGNPVAIEAALATLDLLETSLIDNAARIGACMLERLRPWPERFACVRQVRGLGLMIGIELDAAAVRDRLIADMFERGVLVLGAGQSTLRLCPPLIITEEQADFALTALEDALRVP
jgi:4-aminobutyrate aminotransferase